MSQTRARPRVHALRESWSSSEGVRVMLSNRLAFAALAIACVTAAAAGGYLASRQNAVPASPPLAPPPPPAAPAAERPVQETEAVVGDSAPKKSTLTAEAVPPSSP